MLQGLWREPLGPVRGAPAPAQRQASQRAGGTGQSGL